MSLNFNSPNSKLAPCNINSQNYGQHMPVVFHVADYPGSRSVLLTICREICISVSQQCCKDFWTLKNPERLPLKSPAAFHLQGRPAIRVSAFIYMTNETFCCSLLGSSLVNKRASHFIFKLIFM